MLVLVMVCMYTYEVFPKIRNKKDGNRACSKIFI